VFESERHLPFGGWSYKNLLAVDPRRYSRFRDGRRSADTFPTVVLAQVGGAWAGSSWPHLDAGTMQGKASPCCLLCARPVHIAPVHQLSSPRAALVVPWPPHFPPAGLGVGGAVGG
jgi:hypothetical protein